MNKYNQHGFTLIELLVVMSIIGIMMIAAVPSITNSTKNSAIASTAREFQVIVQLARTEAITRNREVNFHSENGDDWGQGFTLCAVANPDTDCDDTTTIKRYSFASTGVTVKSDATSYINFNERGRLNNGGNPVNLYFCDDRDDGKNQALSIAVTGRTLLNTVGEIPR